MYTLKIVPNDFIVREVSSVTFLDKGKYLYFRLTKTNWNTLDAIKRIAKALHSNLKNFGYAGTKDRHALTQQVCSVLGISKEKIESLVLEGIKIEVLGYGNEPISLGDLRGNEFEITVRNIEDEGIDVQRYFVNYFDEQRFSKNNVEIGRAIVKKKFKKAAKLVDRGCVNDHLQQVPTDFVGALRTLPHKLLLLFVHAYQSYLWNEAVARYFKGKESVLQELPYSQGVLVIPTQLDTFLMLEIPLVGFATEISQKEVKKIVEQILDEEDLEQEDFIIKQIPGLSCEGAQRKVVEEIKDLKISEIEDDDIHPGKKKVIVQFILSKGNYATMVVKQLIS